jgi:hypothetical protein
MLSLQDLLLYALIRLFIFGMLSLRPVLNGALISVSRGICAAVRAILGKSVQPSAEKVHRRKISALEAKRSVIHILT